MAIFETVLKDTVMMTVDEINAKGGVLGKKLKVVVVDPASNWPLFAEKAKQLLTQDKVAVVLGYYDSVSRKSVLPVFRRTMASCSTPCSTRAKSSARTCSTPVATSNQQAIPAVEYLMSKDGGSAKRFVLLGTDYVYPRTTNKILRSFLHSKGITDADIMEEYAPFGHADYQTIIGKIKKFAGEGKKTAVVSTINGDSNVPFYKELGNQGLKATDVPVVALGRRGRAARRRDKTAGRPPGRLELLPVDQEPDQHRVHQVGRSDYAKAKGIAGHKDKPLTNDPMEATYIGIHMWKQAVRRPSRPTSTR